VGIVKNIMVRAVADFSALTTESKKASKSMNDMERNFSQKMGGISASVGGMANGLKGAIAGIAVGLAPATMGVSLVVGAAMAVVGGAMAKATEEAIRYETALTQLNHTLGKSGKGISDWGMTDGAKVGLSETQVASAGAQYGNLISKFVADQGTAARYTQELIQQTAVIASRTGRTQEDVIERIRSGLLGETEAVEDLGIMVNVSMLESTKAFKELAGNTSWAKLNFHQQQQIRLAAILEQSYSSYGATLGDTTASSISKLTAEWNNFVLNVGHAILPIVKEAIEGLTWVIAKVNAVLKVWSVMSNAFFGGKEPPFRNRTDAETKAITEQTLAVKDLDDKIKKVNKSKKDGFLFGFDQITQLPSKNTGDASGVLGGGATPFTQLNEELKNTNIKMTGFADRLKIVKDAFTKLGQANDALKRGKFKAAADYFAEAVGIMWTAWYGKKSGQSLELGLKTLNIAMTQMLKGDFKNAGKNFALALETIKEAVYGKKGEPKRNMAGAIGNISAAMGQLVVPGKAVTGLVNLVKAMKDALSISFNGSGGSSFMSSYVKGIDKMISSLNVFIGKLKRMEVFGKKPFAGLGYIDLIEKQPVRTAGVPQFAKGGVVTKSTYANIGEDGAEAVVPLENNTQWIDKLAAKLGGKMGGGSGDIIIQIGGKEFGRVAIAEINKANRQAGRNLIKV
jgi:hypothetical protein